MRSFCYYHDDNQNCYGWDILQTCYEEKTLVSSLKYIHAMPKSLIYINLYCTYHTLNSVDILLKGVRGAIFLFCDHLTLLLKIISLMNMYDDKIMLSTIVVTSF